MIFVRRGVGILSVKILRQRLEKRGICNFRCSSLPMMPRQAGLFPALKAKVGFCAGEVKGKLKNEEISNKCISDYFSGAGRVSSGLYCRRC